jgi:hypothetical protein
MNVPAVVAVHDAWTALDSLADVYLLTAVGEGHRFRLADPVVWAFAMREAHTVEGPAELAAATRRLVHLVAA